MLSAHTYDRTTRNLAVTITARMIYRSMVIGRKQKRGREGKWWHDTAIAARLAFCGSWIGVSHSAPVTYTDNRDVLCGIIGAQVVVSKSTVLEQKWEHAQSPNLSLKFDDGRCREKRRLLIRVRNVSYCTSTVPYSCGGCSTC